ncbi:MAG: flagellar biosynthesis protein FlhA [Myxococcales bacterium]|nr:flagellar biosynthesis protein FlhA [Myxococcales bacterium]
MSEAKGISTSVGALAFVGVIGLMVIPLPAPVLDVLLAVSLCLALLTFMVALYVERPLDFSSFPSLLLLVTLLRLALNVSTTRRILLYGAEGVDAAGGMIRAFGEFAVGGNFIVGAVVFLILVVVNYIVITKGAERISEVTARFTLDKIPGKQMAIDADLGAGLITETEARERRKGIEKESDFYGAMDGASKFVRGDAVAGLVITAINVVGGILVGLIQHGMSAAQAAETFTILSIGDGLVSQVPALVVSTGAALLTTRSSSGGALGSSLGAQLLGRPRPLYIASGVVGLMGLMPGMPHLAMIAMAGGLVMVGRRGFNPGVETREQGEPGEGARPTYDPNDPEVQKEEIKQLLPVHMLSLEVSLDLLPFLDASRGGELLTRIVQVRKQVALELGVIVPPIHVKDDLRLTDGSYRVVVNGAKVGEGRVRVGQFLAIDPTGEATRGIRGEQVKDPTFGLPAKWVAASERGRAEAVGCPVVDPSTVVATHIAQLIRQHADELVGRKQAQELVELAAKQDEKLVEELIPHLMSLGDVIRVMRGLLREGVSIRDVRTILETLADNAARTKDPLELTELVRQRLGRQITQSFLNESGELRAMVLDPKLEDVFSGRAGPSDPGLLTRATNALRAAAQRASGEDEQPVLVVPERIRRTLAEVALHHVPGLAVLSYREVDPAVPFVTRSIVNLQEAVS